MVSPSAIVANLAALVHLARRQPDTAEFDEAARVLVSALGAAPVSFRPAAGGVILNGKWLPSEALGAAHITEYLQAQGIQGLQLSGVTVPDVRALVQVLAAYPGSFATWQDMVASLGSATERVKLSQAATDLPITHEEAAVELTASMSPAFLAPSMPEAPLAQAEYESLEVTRGSTGMVPPPPKPPPPRDTNEDRKRLDRLIAQGRSAISAGDWNALLDVATEYLESVNTAQSEATARMYRLELRRFITRPEIMQLARLAASGARRDQAIAVLRQLGAEATEILMELVVETEQMNLRRGYFVALSRMTEGTDVVVHHLSHPVWYVVRNAAELCGEMEIDRAVPDLARLATHADERVRKAVAVALIKIGTSTTLEPLSRMIRDASATVRTVVLGNLDGDRHRPLAMPVATLLKGEESPEVMREALFALGRMGTPDALMALRNVAQTETKRGGKKARLQAVEALALARSPARPVLAALAEGKDREVAEAAARALAEFPK